MIHDRQFTAACRHLLKEYEQVFELIQKEVNEDMDKILITQHDDVFKTAKEALKKEYTKEGIKAFIAKLKFYANRTD